MLVIEEAQGPDLELKHHLEQVIDLVILRLLRPFDTGGRQTVPGLIHGASFDIRLGKLL